MVVATSDSTCGWFSALQSGFGAPLKRVRRHLGRRWGIIYYVVKGRILDTIDTGD